MIYQSTISHSKLEKQITKINTEKLLFNNMLINCIWENKVEINIGGHRGRDHDRMVAGFPTTYAISAYHQ
jgi:hypothetical protein